ncbi:MAG: hypothetical protein ROM54_03650, partial [Anaerobiospirillum sp.]|nr:hypothetical protein [Anaerobiospirillum sp.]
RLKCRLRCYRTIVLRKDFVKLASWLAIMKVVNLKGPHRLLFLTIFKEPQSDELWFLSAPQRVTAET